jgi:mycofactocin system glycosyltransferase
MTATGGSAVSGAARLGAAGAAGAGAAGAGDARALTGPPADRLPNGFSVRLEQSVIRADRGRTLFGGSPARLLYLKPAAQRLLAGDRLTVADPGSGLLARLLLDRGLAVPDLAPLPPSGDAAARPAGTPSPADVTVVVPVQDRPDELARLLKALDPRLPVVVVDDGSGDDRTGQVARQAGAVVVRHEVGRGPAAARNAGLAHVRTPLVAFVDSDVEPCDGWLEALLPHFADPCLGLVAPRVLGAVHAMPDDGRVRRWVTEYEASRSSLDLGPAAALVAPRGRVSYVPTAAVVARRVALGAGFDERMQAGEDVDLVWRMVDAGWRVRYDPAAAVRHDHRVDVGPWLRRKAFYGTSAAPLALLHPGAVPPLAAAPWSAAVWALLLVQRRWAVAAAAGVTAVATVRLARRLERSDHPYRAAVQLAPWALTSTGWQTAAGLMRHWWPVTALTCLVSRRARRAALAAAVLEAIADRRRVDTRLGPLSYGVAHRLDDLAYGTGLWLGAWKHRTAAPLLPALSARASSVPPPSERPTATLTVIMHE